MNVRGDFLGSSHGTNTTCVVCKKQDKRKVQGVPNLTLRHQMGNGSRSDFSSENLFLKNSAVANRHLGLIFKSFIYLNKSMLLCLLNHKLSLIWNISHYCGHLCIKEIQSLLRNPKNSNQNGQFHFKFFL